MVLVYPHFALMYTSMITLPSLIPRFVHFDLYLLLSRDLTVPIYCHVIINEYDGGTYHNV
jgi:hypothetical protein